MDYSVVKAKYIRDYVVGFTFGDGSKREVDLEPFLDGPLFAPLRSLATFRSFKVDRDAGTIVWPNGADIAPETLYYDLGPPPEYKKGWFVRDARLEDGHDIVRLWKTEALGTGLEGTIQDVERLVQDFYGTLLVAEADEQIIGTVIAEFGGWRGTFWRLIVESDWQRKGVATALVREGEARMRLRGARRITALVHEENSPATEFWLKAKYTQEGDLTRFVRNFQ
jgi:GNAT superfamily N-acetyltransferase